MGTFRKDSNRSVWPRIPATGFQRKGYKAPTASPKLYERPGESHLMIIEERFCHKLYAAQPFVRTETILDIGYSRHCTIVFPRSSILSLGAQERCSSRCPLYSQQSIEAP